MNASEVAKMVMKVTGKTQTEVAEEAGLSGQGAISMFLRAKSMRVDSLLSMIEPCGYELVARRVGGGNEYPEFVIDRVSGSAKKPEQAEKEKKVTVEVTDRLPPEAAPDLLTELIRKAVAEELAKMAEK